MFTTEEAYAAGLTKRDLALRTGVTATAITQFEKRQARPSAATLARLAAELGLPLTYFAAGRPVLPVAEEATHFRSLRTTRAYERRQARATMSHLAEAVRAIQAVVRLPELRLPHDATSPETAARSLRAYWGLPPGPVHHLVRLVEANGAVVSMARFGAGERIDAFSCRPAGLDRPLICLSRDRGNPLRRRFSAIPYVPSLAYRLGLVARGAIDATFVKANSHDWDLAAADLILAEAGGAILDSTGANPIYASRETRHGALVAGSQPLLGEIAGVIAAAEN